MTVFADEFFQFLLLHVEHFSHGKRVVLLEGFPLHLLQKISHAMGVFDHAGRRRQSIRAIRLVGWEIDVLFDIDNSVDAETAQPLVHPPVDHLVDFPAHFRIFPVQIRLLFREQVQVVQIFGAGHRLPRVSAEIGPIIGRFFPVFPLPDIKVSAVSAFRVFHGLLKPDMLIGAVVDHQVHQDIHPPLLRLFQQMVEVLHGAELFPDAVIVRDVIPLIHKGGFINGRQPDDIDSQLFQIIQFLRHALQIPDSVSVGIQKALGINLIGHLVMPPFLFHNHISFYWFRRLRFLYDTVIIKRKSPFFFYYCGLFFA